MTGVWVHLQIFSSMFTKGDIFHDFLFAFVGSLFFSKQGLLLMVRTAPKGANSSFSKLSPNQKGDKNEKGRVASLESVSIHLNIYSLHDITHFHCCGTNICQKVQSSSQDEAFMIILE